MEKKWTIGRQNSDILFEHESVSKLHGILSFVGGKFFIEDSNSKNGTQIKRGGDYIKVDKKEEIILGDVLYFAGEKISFDDLISEVDLEETKLSTIRCKRCLKPISNINPCPFCGSSLHRS